MNEQIIKKASEIIFSSEGGYSSVNCDDNGAVSVGHLQWHGTRALNLCKKILAALGEEGSLCFISPELYREIRESRSWSHRTLGEEEGECLGYLLSTRESREVQDAAASTDVGAYLSHIESLGVTDEWALIFMADIENQGGAGASARIISAAEGTDIDALYRAACADRVFKNYTARRDRVYQKLTGHPYGEEAYEGELYEVRYGDTLSAIAREYAVSVREIAEENGITNPNLIRTGDLLRIPVHKKEPQAPKAPVSPESPVSPELSSQPVCESYTVVRGDTLSGIGVSLGIPWREIAECNGILPPYVIYAGQTLTLPDTEQKEDECLLHLVVRGDTLSGICRRYGVGVDAILRANAKKYRAMRADYIVVGWELIIPRGET